MAATIYITASDLKLVTDEQYLIDVADDNEDGVADENVIASAIENACSIVDGYVQLSPGLPVTTITGMLKNLASTIAIYLLTLRRRVMHAALRDAYNDAITQLIRISNGEVGTGDPTKATSIRNALSSNKTEDDMRYPESWLETHFPRIGH